MSQNTTPSSADGLVRVGAALFGLTAVLGCPGFGNLDPGLDVSTDDPWCETVELILDTRCTRCHGEEPSNGAPAGMRLDTFEDGPGAVGAATLAGRILARAGDGTMPPPGSPEGQVSADELDFLTGWADAGAPIAECRTISADVGHDTGSDVGTDAGMDVVDDAPDADDVRRDPPDVQPGPPTLEEVHEGVFATDCASHHMDGSVLPFLALDDGLAERLRASSLQLPEMPWVTPGDAENSYLYLKITGAHVDAGGIGNRMPIGPALTTEQTDLVRDWIEGLTE